MGSKASSSRFHETQARLLVAFRELLLTKGYDATSVRDIVRSARIGRSTFYEHFESKEDVLRQSIVPIIAVLAAAVDETSTAPLEAMLMHFLENRRFVRALRDGACGSAILRFLADAVEARLTKAASSPTSVPGELIAAAIAHAQWGLIDHWLESPRDARLLARTMSSASHAIAVVLGASPPARRRT